MKLRLYLTTCSQESPQSILTALRVVFTSAKKSPSPERIKSWQCFSSIPLRMRPLRDRLELIARGAVNEQREFQLRDTRAKRSVQRQRLQKFGVRASSSVILNSPLQQNSSESQRWEEKKQCFFSISKSRTRRFFTIPSLPSSTLQSTSDLPTTSRESSSRVS